MAITTRFYPSHDDIQGILGTALVGVTSFTPKQFRNTGIVLPHIATGDIFSMVFQMPHRKKLDSLMDGIHIHYIPVNSKDGNIAFTYAWGFYNHGTAIPDTLPNTGTVADIGLLTTDQYKLKLNQMVINIAPPAGEGYSSILLCKLTAVAPAAGVNWWTGGNEIALAYMDAHYITDRSGSANEASD